MNAAHARELARQLREARDLMNDSGKHWIKGAESMLVDPDTHEPGGHGEMYAYLATQYPRMQVGYCSIGALHEINADLEAAVALAEVIDPEGMRKFRAFMKDEATAEYGYECEYGYRVRDREELKQYVEDYTLDRILKEAEDIIVGFNDTGQTTWDDVKGAFSRAAKRMADRARKLKG